ncbi:type II toxin-antitoxin system RelE/ParE family toxin [Caulobacter sp. S45]|uniref:type II toxin-antitoxin system RelE/ParE family toxin n=1 Tax=Caulobacter sp. S45 TaxID=1641861 RepID=UPI0020C73E8A|nr:type II toxin-antitoxin system RelE/ParE family toxin [Caulobacter sp. S45]
MPAMIGAERTARVFKTRWFSKAARKALIKDDELCDAIAEVVKGQADDLGGGVFKKRLNRNRHRSIILARGRSYWVYTYLFAKKDRENIDEDELRAFRNLADLYAAKTDTEIAIELAAKELVEICHEPDA